MSTKVVVSGAGIGGLSAAIAMRKLGFEVTVLERNSVLRADGAGLNLWPNSSRALERLGLLPKFREISCVLDRYVSLSKAGEILHHEEIAEWSEKFGAPAAGVLRWDLIKLLAETAGLENIQFDSEVIGYEQSLDKVTVKLANQESVTADAFIAAEGIYSKTRDFFNRKSDFYLNPNHSYRWRGLSSAEGVQIDRCAQMEVYDGRHAFATLPVHDGRVYWFASSPEANDITEFRSIFGSWDRTFVPALIATTPEDAILQSKLQDLADPPECWVDGRVALLGDAAHPMMPDMAQGASQAMLDAAALLGVFQHETSVPEALQAYEELRKPLARRVVELSRQGLYRPGSPSGNSVDPIAVRYEQEIESAGL